MLKDILEKVKKLPLIAKIGLVFFFSIVIVSSMQTPKDTKQVEVKNNQPNKIVEENKVIPVAENNTQKEVIEVKQPVVSNTTNNTNTVQKPQETQIKTDKILYKVSSVVDGDTVKVNIDGKVETLRLIGIDTPETVDPRKPVQCYGKDASDKAKELLLNKSVSLENDPSQGETDKYGRLLRYVFLEDGSNFNLYMIKNGYAREYTYSKAYKYQTSFKEAQTYAQNNKLGLWGYCSTTTTTTNATTPTVTTTETVKAEPVITSTNTTNQICDCSANKYNCPNFKTKSEAQACYDYCYKITGKDIHSLDGNPKNGLACESLPN